MFLLHKSSSTTTPIGDSQTLISVGSYLLAHSVVQKCGLFQILVWPRPKQCRWKWQ